MPPLQPTLTVATDMVSMILAALPASLPQHPLVLLTIAGTTALILVSGCGLAVLAGGALVCYGLRGLSKRHRREPLPLITPWQKHALAVMRRDLPVGWTVHSHVNPVVLICKCCSSGCQAPLRSPSRAAPPGAMARRHRSCRSASSDRTAAALAAASHHIPFTITDSASIPRAVIIITEARATRGRRKSDEALKHLFLQHGIATHFLALGSRPDWRALAQMIVAEASPIANSALSPVTNAALSAPPADASTPSRSAVEPFLATLLRIRRTAGQVLSTIRTATPSRLSAFLRSLWP